MPQVQAQFTATKEPIYAWHAYSLTRSAGLAVPKWVHDYLEIAATNLWSLRGAPPKRRQVGSTIAEALGFVPGGCGSSRFGSFTVQQQSPATRQNQRKKDGAFNPFKRSDEFSIAFTVYAARSDGTKLLHAYEDAARQHGVSRRTAERAWTACRSYFPTDQIIATK